MTDDVKSCATCQHSEHFEDSESYCKKRQHFAIRVLRTDICDDYTRESGTEGDEL